MRWFQTLQDNFRYRLAHAEALPQLTLLGILSGLMTSAVAIAYRLLIELPLAGALPSGSESFEALSQEWHFLLPVIGLLTLGIISLRIKAEHRQTGVGHVIERLHQHQARISLRNTLFQFWGGIVAILSGAPLGREGPAIHLGAGSSSLVGQYLKLPNNSLRVLAGCGVAAAIAASFNTPLAGVIFAMEVVLMEYTIVGFIPVILASIIGALGSRLVFGTEPAFSVPPVHLASLLEIPYIALCGLLIGLAASLMLTLFKTVKPLSSKPFLLNCLLAGLLTGSIAFFYPQIMGVGYDTVELALLGDLALFTLLGIALAKLVAASVVSALGIPGGLIGPTFVIGACLGSALGIIGIQLNPTDQTASGFYAILGMAAMMGAVLNAPLAALIAVLELTYNPNILLPSMLVIVIACITSRTITRLPGIFAIGQDLDRYSSPVFQLLSRAGVTSLMTTRLAPQPAVIDWQAAKQLLAERPEWIVIDNLGETKYILRPVDLARYLDEQDKSLWEESQPIQLMDIAGDRRQLAPVSAESTLQQAFITMKQYNLRAVYIYRQTTPAHSEVAGIVTYEAIDNYYQ